jgi:hypothetical protein
MLEIFGFEIREPIPEPPDMIKWGRTAFLTPAPLPDDQIASIRISIFSRPSRQLTMPQRLMIGTQNLL